MRTYLPLALSACLTALVAGPAAPARAQGSLDDVVRRYLAARTDAEREALDRRLAAHDGLTAAAYRRAIERARVFPDLKGERRPIARTVDIGDGRKVEVFVQVPRSYDPRRKWPLLVAFMGPSTDGRASLAAWSRAYNEYVVAAPSLPADHPTYSGRPRYETALRAFEALLEALSAEMRIDHDRVFVAGHSHGGAIAWFCAAYLADRVAGAVPAAGHSTYTKEDLENLSGTASIYAIHGAKDDAVPVAASRESVSWLERFDCDHVYHEFDGGHEFPTARIPDILAWMGTKARKPLPARIRHTTSSQWNTTGRVFWVEVVRPRPLDDIVDLTATVDRAANRIDIRIDGAQEIELGLNERLIDPKREVTVLVDGAEAFRGQVPFRARAALDSFRARRDLDAISPGAIRLEVGRPRR